MEDQAGEGHQSAHFITPVSTIILLSYILVIGNREELLLCTAGDTEDTEDLVAGPCVSKEVLLRNSWTFVARILISINLPSP